MKAIQPWETWRWLETGGSLAALSRISGRPVARLDRELDAWLAARSRRGQA